VAGRHHVVLVPGFFGFANLGDFAYFGHVRDLLVEIGPGLGLDGEIRALRTEPTASLTRRAALLCQGIAELLEGSPGDVTVVGHSSGGLDARLLVSPGVELPTPVDVERCARSVRSVVTISTPHHGTPLAQGFKSFVGQQLLQLLSLATIHVLRTGRLPISAALKLARLARSRGSKPGGVVDQVFLELLDDFSADRRKALEAFFANVKDEQGLLGQIAPAGMEVFNASTQDRPGLRYGCVVTRARPPGLGSLWRAGLDPYAQATHAAFVGLYRFASRTPEGWRPRLTGAHADAMRKAYGRIPGPDANDGIVPTLAQVRGDIVAAAWADHHDVLGHFHAPTHVPPHFDWMASGTGFDREQFVAVWRRVASWAAGPVRPVRA
jgi:triacylglycerol lipase